MQSLITEPLGLYGWKNLEPVILAALSIQAPILLIGKHGTAKSFILERISEALNMRYRFYNASLINYDDLVGIPIPSEDKKSLEYISNNSSIWDAEVVFIDEINRTKPELQNKLFPIIHEKRVQGIDLKKLQYRFAAMNPSYIDSDDDDEENEENYFGAMPMDPALIDRFPFIIEVPSWDNLDEADKKKVLLDHFKGRHEFNVNINDLIQETKENYIKCKNKMTDNMSKYIINLMQLLENSFGYISTRRATSMLETLLAIHAARITLNKYNENEDVKIEDTLDLHILNTLPYIVNKKIEKFKLISIVNEVWSAIGVDDIHIELLKFKKGEDRILYLIKHKDDFDVEELAKNILASLSVIKNKERRAMALIVYLKLREKSDLPASFMETLHNEVKDCFEIKNTNVLCHNDKKRIESEVVKYTSKNNNLYHNNLLNSFLPDKYNDISEVGKLSTYFMLFWEEAENG